MVEMAPFSTAAGSSSVAICVASLRTETIEGIRRHCTCQNYQGDLRKNRHMRVTRLLSRLASLIESLTFIVVDTATQLYQPFLQKTGLHTKDTRKTCKTT